MVVGQSILAWRTGIWRRSLPTPLRNQHEVANSGIAKFLFPLNQNTAKYRKT